MLTLTVSPAEEEEAQRRQICGRRSASGGESDDGPPRASDGASARRRRDGGGDARPHRDLEDPGGDEIRDAARASAWRLRAVAVRLALGLNRSNATFLGELPLATLPATISPLRGRATTLGRRTTRLSSLASGKRRVGCEFCAYAATVRVDWMTQCHGFSELLARRQQRARSGAGSAIGARKLTLVMLLDASLTPVAHGWLSSRPNAKLGALAAALTMVDARLFVHGDRLWVVGTLPQRQYDAAVAPLHLALVNASAARAGGLRAWVPNEELRRLVAPQARPLASFLRPWIAAPFPVVARAKHRLRAGPAATPRAARRAGTAARPRSACRCVRRPGGRRGVDQFVRRRRVHRAAESCRLSLNGVLLRVDEWGWLVGVGHLHRGHRDTLMGRPLPRKLAYFGHHYTHFFYALDAAPPFAVRAVSGEWCIGDCEVIQYVSGMARTGGGGGEELLLSFGVNDCEARVARLPLAEVRRMLVTAGSRL